MSRAPSTPAPDVRRVLIVEDERDLARVLKRHVEGIGCEVQLAGTGEEAVALGHEEFDLVLLDVMLPGIDGMEVCRRLRSLKRYMPVLMLTARSSDIDKVMGLEAGADDYLTKPFSVQELLARIKAIFRRMDAMSSAQAARERPLEVGDGIRIELGTREVRVRGQPVDLTQKEFELLLHFAQNPGRVYSRAQLLDAVWGYHHDGYEHAVNCHINRLRAKIEADPGEPKLLLTVWGVGYKFSPEPAASQ
ncbi:MAG: response regulator transcription factor [Proteobacteria bacterium]|nr:response regulator transcription factor [Pseudomonadota bacterium]